MATSLPPAVQAARFVAASCGFTDGEPTASTSSPGSVQLTIGGSTMMGLATVCRYIAQSQTQLLGGSLEAEAQISEWLTWATTELTPLMDDKLFKVNDHLLSRTYLVGNTVTVADLVIYALVHPAAAGFPVAQTLHFCHLLRWYDLVQNTADAAGFFPRVTFSKPRYQPPAAPAPKAAPAPAAAAATPAAPPAANGKEAAAPKAAAKEPNAAPAPAAPAAAAAGAAPAAAAAPADGDGKKKQKEPKAAADGAKKGGDAKKDDDEVRIDMLDIRVGRIVKVGKHPNADSLYLEEIDLGEPTPRSVISGLVNFVPVEAMQDRVVLVVCNLKPAKMRDVMSYGMVLCASNDAHDKVEPVVVPEGVVMGERVTVEGFTSAPLDEIKPNKKILDRLAPDMKTDANGVFCFKDQPFTTSKGPPTSSITNAFVK